MVMKQLLFALVLVMGAAGCNKPTAEDCRQAITNMQKLHGTDGVAKNTDNEAEVRRCKGGSSKEAVACAMKAATVDELRACKFMGSKSSN
jgi:hypothetical protein